MWYLLSHCRARNEDVVVISRLGIVASIFRHRYPNILNEFQFKMILGNINGEDIASVNVSPGELFGQEGSQESSTGEIFFAETL